MDKEYKDVASETGEWLLTLVWVFDTQIKKGIKTYSFSQHLLPGSGYNLYIFNRGGQAFLLSDTWASEWEGLRISLSTDKD